MARTLTNDMAASLQREDATFARLWTFTRPDGAVLRITDHDQNIRVGGFVFRSNIGFTPTAVVSSLVSFGSQQCEINVVMTDDGIREADVRARKWERTKAVFSIVDYLNPTSKLDIYAGNFGRISITEKGRATIEILGLGSDNSNVAKDLYSMTCRNSLGDALCGVNIESMRANFTVLLVTDVQTFVANNLLGRADGFYSLGQLVWDTGANAGDVSEVQTSLLTNEIGLFFPTPKPIQIGDTGHVYPGCDLLVATCRDKFDRVREGFNGEPFNIQPSVVYAPPSSGSPGAVHRQFLAAAS